ncbi:MAG TPA: winged helix-turn-helix domain-containing protein [Gemmatimonadaceae bacterium]|nr:winged helix-turn-helix domain-containing protein [Gemmatimonadaceae bacterium]
MTASLSLESAVASVAGAIGEPTRARMLYALMDGHARTSTELAIIAQVSPSTASIHLARLEKQRLVRVFAQGKHRYYSLTSNDVAQVLEGLTNLAGAADATFIPTTPTRLRVARSCYDHLAGELGVALHDRFMNLGWIVEPNATDTSEYTLTPAGQKALAALGVDIDDAQTSRRKFAFGCLDWSERRPHIGGSLGAALLSLMLRKRWLTRERDNRALVLTKLGERELRGRLSIRGATASGSSRP